MSEQMVFSCENNKRVVCIIEFEEELPVANWKATEGTVHVYTSLMLKLFKHLYLIAGKENGAFSRKKMSFTAPEGAIIHVYYRTGSHKHATLRFHQFFMVKEGARTTVTIPNEPDWDHYRHITINARVENLIPLDRLTDEQIAIVEAEVANRYGAKRSQYAPVALLYWYWVKQPPTAPAPVPTTAESREGEPLPEEELSLRLEVPVSTAVVTQPQPPALSPAPSFERLVEEARIELERLLSEGGYSEAKLIVFDLPTEYEGAQTYVELTKEGLVERKVLDLKRTSRLRTLRRSFYDLLNRYAARTKAGWLLLSKELPEALRGAIEKVNGERPGSVEVVTVILPRDWLEREVEDWTKRLEATKDLIAQQLADEATSNVARKRLERRKKEVEEALERARLYLASLKR